MEVLDRQIWLSVRKQAEFEAGSLRAVTLTKGARALVGRLKGTQDEAPMTFVFDRTCWTRATAVRWLVDKGGEGSGHFGHAGRIGLRGGSLPSDAAGGESANNEPNPNTAAEDRPQYGSDTAQKIVTAAKPATPARLQGVLDSIKGAFGAERWARIEARAQELMKVRMELNIVRSHRSTQRAVKDGRLTTMFDAPNPREVVNEDYYNRRVEAEQSLGFGDTHPVYGSVNPEAVEGEPPFDIGNAERYGEAQWVLTEDMWDNATFVVGDSLHGDTKFLLAGREAVQQLMAYKLAMMEVNGRGEYPTGLPFPIVSYIEAQFHVPVTLDKVKLVRVSKSEPETADALRSVGVKVEVREPNPKDESEIVYTRHTDIRSGTAEYATNKRFAKGGAGSGHYGHAGRVGLRGGSLPRDAAASSADERPARATEERTPHVAEEPTKRYATQEDNDKHERAKEFVKGVAKTTDKKVKALIDRVEAAYRETENVYRDGSYTKAWERVKARAEELKKTIKLELTCFQQNYAIGLTLRAGRLQSMFASNDPEAVKGEGYYENRVNAEELHGFTFSRPVYGAVNPVAAEGEKPFDIGNARAYGDVQWVLSDDLWDSVSFTVGDSFNRNPDAFLVTGREAVQTLMAYKLAIAEESSGSATPESIDGALAYEYIEAQFHAPVTMEQVQYARVSEANVEAIDRLTRAGVPIKLEPAFWRTKMDMVGLDEVARGDAVLAAEPKVDYSDAEGEDGAWSKPPVKYTPTGKPPTGPTPFDQTPSRDDSDGEDSTPMPPRRITPTGRKPVGSIYYTDHHDDDDKVDW